MTPQEFIERLARHYGKRHASEKAQQEWLEDVAAVLKNTDQKVLRKAYEIIRDEYDERSFPVPATLRKFITRAADIVHPESKAKTPFHYNGPSKRAPDTQQEIETCKVSREWQHEMMRKHGTWANWWRTVKDTYDDGKSKRSPEVENTTATAGDTDWQRMQRPGFEAMQQAFRNRHMRKPNLTSRSRAMSGDDT